MGHGWTIREGMKFHKAGITRIQVKLGKAVHVKDFISNHDVIRKAWGE